MEHKTALRRLNLLKGHIQPSDDARREKATSTINVAHAQEKVWATLPSGFFDAIE